MIIAKERLQLAESLKDETLINQGLMNIADVMNKMGKHENALDYAWQSETERKMYKRILIFIISITPFIYPAIMMPNG